MTPRMNGKTVVVTAAASGIGRAIARRLAQDGAATIHCLDIDPAVTRVASEIQALGPSAHSHVLDLTDRTAVPAVFAAIGDVDVLVNGVGSSARDKVGEFATSDPSTWDFVIDTSLKSAMLASRQVVSGMRRRRHGRIVSISTDAWLYPTKNFADYAAAKAGVVGFTRALALEEAVFGINVNAVSPGPVRAGGTAKLPADMLARIVAEVPLGRMGEPEDVAHLVAFLVSDEASWITGQNVAINGGRTMP